MKTKGYENKMNAGGYELKQKDTGAAPITHARSNKQKKIKKTEGKNAISK